MTTPVPKDLIERLTASGLEGIYNLELRGDDGGTWYFRVGDGLEIVDSIGADVHPDVIVRSDRGSLTALLEGRMTVSDGIVAERLSLVGDVTKIVRLKDALFAKTDNGGLP